MRALTVAPGIASSARVEDVADPPHRTARFWCARSRSAFAAPIVKSFPVITVGRRRAEPAGDRPRIARQVREAPADCGIKLGDFVVGIVRRPDPVPCSACAIDEWDMCRNGRYTERGIKERNGYGAEYFRIEPEFVVKVDASLGIAGVLLEPTSVVAKAWDHAERIGKRTRSWQPKDVAW